MEVPSAAFRPDASNASGVVPCAVHRNRPDRGYVAIQISCDLQVHARELHFPRKQVRNSVPVPRRADSAVYQGSSPASQHLRRVGDESGERPADNPQQEIPIFLLTVGWLHLKIFAAAAWTILRRISATTRTTEQEEVHRGRLLRARLGDGVYYLQPP